MGKFTAENIKEEHLKVTRQDILNHGEKLRKWKQSKFNFKKDKIKHHHAEIIEGISRYIWILSATDTYFENQAISLNRQMEAMLKI